MPSTSGVSQHATVAFVHNLPYKLIQKDFLGQLIMILDKQAVLERIEHDQQLYDDICKIFRDDVPKTISRLISACEHADIPAATRHAHSLKSAAASIGAIELCETAGKAERALQAGDLGDMESLLSAIGRNMSRVLETLA